MGGGVGMTDPLDEPPAQDIRVYRVYTVDDGDITWYHCPVCGLLAGFDLLRHGPEHIIQDASA